ncbi:hypothetical protein KP79_PYT22114 [Mizuhopecten yessoensis]|uniref:ZP domain-containing protein n=2 Tax=Mizuhopecten yessoensis TaxID=6573 RepID=A0A210R4X3_MIZYE|nr:hypothetical protein KP79_PYT22114 [Mizuhopecten yessoensis]
MDGSVQAATPGTPTTNPHLKFHCNPDDNIIVTLTSAETFYYNVEWTCNGSTPSVVTVTTNEQFFVTCNKGENVTVTVLMSSSSTPIPSVTPITIIRNEKETFAFQCTEITSSGIVLFTNTSLNDKIPFAYMGTQKPELQLQMYVTTAANNNIIKSITIGETYKLHIDGPENYVVIPQKCYAADVSSGATGDRNVTLLENGCPCDTDIFKTKFQINSQDLGKVEVDFNGFRFVGSRNIFLECKVHVCPPDGCENSLRTLSETSAGCHDPSKTVAPGTRKRRSVIQQKSIAIARTAFVVHDSRIIASSAVGKEPVSTLIILCGLLLWIFAQRFQ